MYTYRWLWSSFTFTFWNITWEKHGIKLSISYILNRFQYCRFVTGWWNSASSFRGSVPEIADFTAIIRNVWGWWWINIIIYWISILCCSQTSTWFGRSWNEWYVYQRNMMTFYIYTHFPGCNILDWSGKSLSKAERCVLNENQQFLMVFMKLRQNFPFLDLAKRFTISASTVSR